MKDNNSSLVWTEAAWKKAIYSIWDRSCDDPEFRTSATSDPRTALEQASGLPLPPDVNITFDASEDAATLPSFKDTFLKHKPAVIKLPQTKTEVTVTAR
jgi:hypothetical protein